MTAFVPKHYAHTLRRLTLCAALAIPDAAASAAPAAPVHVRLATSAIAVADATTTEPQRRSSRSRRVRPRTRALPALRHTTPSSAGALATDIRGMLGARTRNGNWGVLVVSLTRGDTLYSVNPDAHFTPASTMKLFTAALAFEQLGPEYQFSTDVLRDGPLAPDGTLHGNLVLRGDGDPALSNRFLRGDPNAPMALLAHFVAGAGVRRVRGDLIADATAFDAQTVPDGWLSRYLQSSYAARVSALSLNENLIWVAVHPGNAQGVRVGLEPNTTTIPVVSTVRSVAGSRGGRISVRRLGNGTIEARGWIGTRSVTRRYSLVVEDPVTFTAGALRAALAERGIVIDGSITVAATPAGAVKIASLPSPPVDRLAAVMNRESVNHYAELLYRNAARGRTRSAQGSAASGAALLQSFMTRTVGASPNAVFAADGSGLSTLDRVTPRALVQLLGYAHRAPWASAFHSSLPVAGESELLRHRMRYTPAHGNLHAKTGTTNEVISLAGYTTAQDGEVIAFAFIYNGADRWNARETIDAMGATLASFVRE